jgi:microsomal dipeptidase-like Zn-dependent dipeptidase
MKVGVKYIPLRESIPDNVIQGLQARGWTQVELDKVLGANLLRVYERAWGA